MKVALGRPGDSVRVGAHGQQTFRSGVEAVAVDALVMDGRRPVGGLTASDFALRDSGVVQSIDTVAFEDVPLNVILALDTSKSVDGAPLEELKQAAAGGRASPAARRSGRPDHVQRLRRAPGGVDRGDPAA